MHHIPDESPIPRYDRAFDTAMKQIVLSNGAMRKGQFRLAMDLFVTALEVLKANHKTEIFYRDRHVRRGSNT